jgi:hypothetical protein
MDKIALKLQERLVQTCIDFINEYKDDEQVKEIQMVEFRANSLQESAKHGEWQPCTDSYCALTGTKPITIGKYADTGDDVVINEGYLIDSSY